MKRKLAAVLIALCLIWPVGGNASDEKTVLTSFYPVYIITANLLENVPGVKIQNLAAPEIGCLHDYQLTTADMKALAGADAFIVNGAGMESFLSDVAAQFKDLRLITATEGMTLLQEGNAHAWLSAKGAAAMATTIAAGLTAALPENEKAIEENLKGYLKRIETLDATLQAGLEPLYGKAIVTFHEAFPYFAETYGLQIAAVIEREPGEALNPRELKELVETIRSLDNPPLFIEPQYPDLAARTLATETGAKVYTLDPIVTGPLGNAALTCYEETMLKNMEALIEAFRQS